MNWDIFFACRFDKNIFLSDLGEQSYGLSYSLVAKPPLEKSYWWLSSRYNDFNGSVLQVKKEKSGCQSNPRSWLQKTS